MYYTTAENNKAGKFSLQLFKFLNWFLHCTIANFVSCIAKCT